MKPGKIYNFIIKNSPKAKTEKTTISGTASSKTVHTTKIETNQLKFEAKDSLCTATATKITDSKTKKLIPIVFLKCKNLTTKKDDISIIDKGGDGVLGEREINHRLCKIGAEQCSNPKFNSTKINKIYSLYSKFLMMSSEQLTTEEEMKTAGIDKSAFAQEMKGWKKDFSKATNGWKKDYEHFETTGNPTKKKIPGISKWEQKGDSRVIQIGDIDGDGKPDRVYEFDKQRSVDCSKIDLIENPYEVTVDNSMSNDTDVFLETEYEEAQKFCSGIGKPGNQTQRQKEFVPKITGDKRTAKSILTGKTFKTGQILEFKLKDTPHKGKIKSFEVLPTKNGDYKLAAKIALFHNKFDGETGKLAWVLIDNL